MRYFPIILWPWWENEDERADLELPCFQTDPFEQWLIRSGVILTSILGNPVLNQPVYNEMREGFEHSLMALEDEFST